MSQLITGAEDLTERAFHTLCGVIDDFKLELMRARALPHREAVARTNQLRERIKACWSELDELTNIAAAAEETLTLKAPEPVKARYAHES